MHARPTLGREGGSQEASARGGALCASGNEAEFVVPSCPVFLSTEECIRLEVSFPFHRRAGIWQETLGNSGVLLLHKNKTLF